MHTCSNTYMFDVLAHDKTHASLVLMSLHMYDIAGIFDIRVHVILHVSFMTWHKSTATDMSWVMSPIDIAHDKRRAQPHSQTSRSRCRMMAAVWCVYGACYVWWLLCHMHTCSITYIHESLHVSSIVSYSNTSHAHMLNHLHGASCLLCDACMMLAVWCVYDACYVMAHHACCVMRVWCLLCHGASCFAVSCSASCLLCHACMMLAMSWRIMLCCIMQRIMLAVCNDMHQHQGGWCMQAYLLVCCCGILFLLYASIQQHKSTSCDARRALLSACIWLQCESYSMIAAHDVMRDERTHVYERTDVYERTHV
jgi:hypothetical protein